VLTAKDETQIKKLMTLLDISREEAEDCVEYDKQVDKMTMKELNATMSEEEKKIVSAMSRTQRAVNAYGRTVTRERKIDDDKTTLINKIAETLGEMCDKVTITNTQREIEIEFNSRKFKIVLSAPRS